jgi:hypothetical protein
MRRSIEGAALSILRNQPYKPIPFIPPAHHLAPPINTFVP